MHAALLRTVCITTTKFFDGAQRFFVIQLRLNTNFPSEQLLSWLPDYDSEMM